MNLQNEQTKLVNLQLLTVAENCGQPDNFRKISTWEIQSMFHSPAEMRNSLPKIIEELVEMPLKDNV